MPNKGMKYKHGVLHYKLDLNIFPFFVVLEIKPRALCTLGKHYSPELHSQA
jgi:hypothetical protein